MCAADTPSSPPTITVISPVAARWTPPVTGASSVAIAALGRERRQPQELVPVVRAHVDPRSPARPARRAPAVGLEHRADRRRRGQARDHGVARSATSAGEPAQARPRPEQLGRAPVAVVHDHGKPARTRLAARWPPSWPTPTKPTRITARTARRQRRRWSSRRRTDAQAATSSSSSTPSPGSVDGIDVAVLPCDRSSEDLRVEAAPATDAFEDEEVRAAGGELDVRRTDHGTAVEVRCDLRVVRLGHRRRSSSPRGCRRRGRGSAAGSPPLPSGARVRTRPSSSGAPRSRSGSTSPGRPPPSPPALGRDGLLEPERVEALEPPGEADRARCGELAVCSEEQIAAVADRLAHLADVALGPCERLEARLARVERRVRRRGVELERREALRDVLGGALARRDPDRCRRRSDRRLRIEVRVRRSRSCTRPPSSSYTGLPTALPTMSQHAISIPLRTPTSERSGRRVAARRRSGASELSIANGSAPSTWRAKTSSIIASTRGGERRRVHLADALDAVVRISVRKTKYRPPNDGGGFPTTKTSSRSSASSSCSERCWTARVRDRLPQGCSHRRRSVHRSEPLSTCGAPLDERRRYVR